LSQPEPPPLEEPWQAEALALSMALMQAGRISAAEWAAGLRSAIKQAQATGDPDDGSTYYYHVLDALEALAFEKALTTRDALAACKEAWRAGYASTPHGQPIQLPRSAPPTGGSEGSASSLLAG
jgi:nitrile hydratase accessory protein